MTRPVRTRRTARILSMLAAALLFVQVLGLMHAVLHDHARTGVHAPAAANRLGQPADESTFGGLFSKHDSQADCDRFDHITHADSGWFESPQFAFRRTARIAIVAVHRGWHIAPQAAGFFARGPPPQA